MTQQIAPASNLGWSMVLRTLMIGAIAIGILAISEGPAGLQTMAHRLAGAHPHLPDMALLSRAPMVLKIHLATILMAFAIGTAQMLGIKGTLLHRVRGWIFVVFLLFSALDALLIRDGDIWRPNPIQIFSVIVLIGLPLAVLAARRHDIAYHASAMTGIYFGSLLLAGILAFLPDRLLWRVFFG